MQTDIPPKRRLNPFAFPAETNVRFTLLILAVCMFSVSMSRPLGIVLRLAFNPEQGIPSDETIEVPGIDSPDGEDLLSPSQALSGVGEALGSLAVPAGVILVVFALAVAVYRTHPARIRRRKNLTPLAHDRHRALHRHIQDLANLVGISPAPNVELGKGSRSQNGQAFGLSKNPVLGLGGGVRVLLVKAPARFRALVLHELAHIANRDVTRTYFSEALWRAVIYMTALPFVIVMVGLPVLVVVRRLLTEGMSGSDILIVAILNVLGFLIVLFMVGVPLAVIVIIRAGLLRVREFYADWRAALWGAEAPLLEILTPNTSKEKSRRKLGLRFHPTAQERLRLLKDPTGLFRLTLDLPFITGLLLAFVTAGLISIVFPIGDILLSGAMAFVAGLAEQTVANSSRFLAALTDLILVAADLVNIGFFLILVFGLGYLIAGTVGLQIQREAVAAVVTGHKGWVRNLRLGGLAALIAVGLEVGFLVTPPYVFSPLGAIIGGIADPLMQLMIFPWLVGFTIFTWLGLLYGRFFARAVLGSHASKSPPKWKRRFLTLALSSLLCVLYFPLLAGRLLIIYPFPFVDQLLERILWPGLIVAPILYVGAFGGTWMLTQVSRLVRPARCPFCGQITRQQYAAGQVCGHCNKELAPWLFAAPPTTTQVSAMKSKVLTKAQA